MLHKKLNKTQKKCCAAIKKSYVTQKKTFMST